MVMRTLFLPALGFVLASCSEPGSTKFVGTAAIDAQREDKMPRPQGKPFDGWGPFAFGMTFDDALTAYPAVAWDAKSVRECRTEMASGNCVLSSAKGSRVPPTAGIAMLPSIVFNQDGKLAAVRLREIRREKTEPAQCRRAYDQLLEYLTETWGPPMASASPEDGLPKRTTPPGYELLPGTGDGAVIGRETFHVMPDGRQIILRASYIGATESTTAICHLGIDYGGPTTLQPPSEERPHPLKNWS